MLTSAVASIALAMVALTSHVAAFRGQRALVRERARRRRRVMRNPDLANLGDVSERLRAEIEDTQLVEFAVFRIASVRMDGPSLWIWLDHYGPHALVYALAAGQSRMRLLLILQRQEVFDMDEAALFARLNQPGLFQTPAN